MKLITFLSITACCLSLSCSSNQNRASDNTLNTDTPSVGDHEELSAGDSEYWRFKPVEKELNTEYVYVFENDTIRQRVVLNYLTDIEISFRYTVENKIRQQNAVIRGTAKNRNSEIASEVDEDEEGEERLAYFVDEYIHSNDCRLAFRINTETLALLRIKAADCLSNPSCPFESVEKLKLVDWNKQIASLEKIEQEIQKNIYKGEEIPKQFADLNGDGKDDLIYSYSWGKITRVQVYLQSHSGYIEVIYTGCTDVALQTSPAGNKQLRLVENAYYGESPFTSYRTFIFDETSACLVENYIVTNEDYTGGKMTVPSSLQDEPYYIKTITNNNLRFSPDMDVFENSSDISFTLDTHKNIIAVVKAGARMKVLSELPVGERTWLFVEVREKSLANSQVTDFDTISFFRDHQHPSVRGWVSNRFVKRE